MDLFNIIIIKLIFKLFITTYLTLSTLFIIHFIHSLIFKMNSLPKELEDIIVDYKNQMEHREKYEKTLMYINLIQYDILDGDSWRGDFNNHNTIQYYGGWNHAHDYYNSINELWIHKYNSDENIEEEIKVINESHNTYDIIDYSY